MIFYLELVKNILFNFNNNFSIEENYDKARFGEVKQTNQTPITFKGRIRKILVKEFNNRGYSVRQQNNDLNENIIQQLENIQIFLPGLENLYHLLADEKSKDLLIQI